MIDVLGVLHDYLEDMTDSQRRATFLWKIAAVVLSSVISARYRHWKPISRMYTSVHYVVTQNSKMPRHAEIQVRTLSEEIWGEVSHLVNYPDKTKSISLQEQLKALARVASSCTRLVDSIFKSAQEYDEISKVIQELRNK